MAPGLSSLEPIKLDDDDDTQTKGSSRDKLAGLFSNHDHNGQGKGSDAEVFRLSKSLLE